MAGISSDLDLETDSAFASIDRIDAALQQAADAFKVSLSDALDILGSVTVGDVDASPVTAAIDAAVSSADTTVTPEVDDADAVTAAIDAAVAGADTQLTLDLDESSLGGIEEAITAAVEAADTTVVVEADTSGAEAQIAGLGEAAASTSTSTDGLSGSLSGVQEHASSAGEATAGMTAGLLGGNAALAGATAGVAGYVAALGAFFETGVKSQGAIERLDTTLGVFKKNVETIRVGDLNTSLGELAHQTGSSGAGMRQAASSAAQLQIAAGASKETASQFSAQLLALSGRAVALNPNLGETGQVADSMGRALARGGRFAAQYGISLTTAEIKARAATNAQQGLGDGVSQAALQMAGAQLATEKYGDSLSKTLAQGAKSPELQLRALQKELASVVAEVSRPLVSPVLDLLRAGLPAISSLARILGASFAAVVPAITPIFNAVSKVVDAIAGPLALAFTQLGPPLAEAGKAVGDVILALLPLEPLVASVAQLMSAVLGSALHAVSALLEGLTPVIRAVATAINAVIGPIADLLGGIFGATGPTVDLQKAVTGLGTALTDQGAAAAASADHTKDAASAAATADKSFSEYLHTASSFAQLNLSDALDESKVSLDEVRAATQGGAKELDSYRTSLIASAAAGNISIFTALKLADAARGEQIAFRQAAQAKIDDAVASGEITKAQAAEIISTNRGTAAVDKKTLAHDRSQLAALKAAKADGVDVPNAMIKQLEAAIRAESATTDYAGALGDVAAAAADNAAKQQFLATAEKQAQTAAAASAATYVQFAETVASTPLGGGEEIAAFAERLGLLPDQVQPVVDAVNASIKSMSDTFVQQLPKASDAFADMQANLDGSFNLEDFIAKLNLQALTIAQFPNTIRFLTQSGFADLANFIATQGAAASATLIQALVKAGPDGARALDDALKRVREGGAASAKELEALAVPLANALGISIEAAKQALGQGATAAGVEVGTDLGAGIGTGGVPATQESLDAVQLQIAANNAAFATAGTTLATSANVGWNTNLDMHTATAAEIRAAQLGYGNAAAPTGKVAGKVGSDASAAYGAGLDLGSKSNVALDAARDILKTNSLVKAVALSSGIGIGQSLSQGMTIGVSSLAANVAQAAVKVVNGAEIAARKAAGIQSPSKVFAELGGYLAEGLAVGIDEKSAQAIEAARVMVVATSVAAAAVAPVSGATSSGSGAAPQINVTVNTLPGTETEARQMGTLVGAAAGRAWVSEVAAQ